MSLKRVWGPEAIKQTRFPLGQPGVSCDSKQPQPWAIFLTPPSSSLLAWLCFRNSHRMCGSEGRLVGPVLGEPLKRFGPERRGSVGWEGRRQSKSPAPLQCKLAENHRCPAGRPGDQNYVKPEESGSREADAGRSVHPDSGFRPARGQGGIAGLKNSCRVGIGNLYSVLQFRTGPWQALRRVFKLTRSHHSPMFLSSPSTELDLGGWRGSGVAGKSSFSLRTSYPPPPPTRGPRKSGGLFSACISEVSNRPHPLPMVGSLPAFLPARDKRAGPSPGWGEVAWSPPWPQWAALAGLLHWLSGLLKMRC